MCNSWFLTSLSYFFGLLNSFYCEMTTSLCLPMSVPQIDRLEVTGLGQTPLNVSCGTDGSFSTAEDGTPDPQRTKQVIAQLQQKILKLTEQIKIEQTARDDNVAEYLKLANNADKLQSTRIKQVQCLPCVVVLINIVIIAKSFQSRNSNAMFIFCWVCRYLRKRTRSRHRPSSNCKGNWSTTIGSCVKWSTTASRDIPRMFCGTCSRA